MNESKTQTPVVAQAPDAAVTVVEQVDGSPWPRTHRMTIAVWTVRPQRPAPAVTS